MILRKPYAFFIKFFRLYHVVLTIISIYLAYRTFLILEFYNDYTSTIISVVGQDLTGNLMYGWYGILPFIGIGILAIILFVMVFKKKPFTFYIFSIISFIALIIIQQIVTGNLNEMSDRLVDVRSILLIRDVIIILFLSQIVNSITLFVRSIGLDIKKFGFKEDLNQLDISDADREEFEVNVSVDYNVIKRRYNYFKRKIKYIYFENKLLVYVLGVLFISLASTSIYLIFNQETHIFNYNEIISANGISVKIENAYVTEINSKGNVIKEGYAFLIVDLQVKKNSTSRTTLDTVTTKLDIGNYSYYPTTLYNEDIIEFGFIYDGEELDSNFRKTILVYELPIELLEREMYFEYVNKNINVENSLVLLNPKLIDSVKGHRDYILGETILISNDFIENYEFEIIDYVIADKISVPYQVCYDECFDFIEVFYPKINTNYNKTVMAIEGNFNYTDKTLQGINDMYDFIYNFGYIEYVINGETKRTSISTEIIPEYIKNDYIYFTVLDEVKDAESVKFEFIIKDMTYSYTLK